MGKLLVLWGLACAAAWYFFVGPGAKLDEDMVREFYVQESHATLSRNPEALCARVSSKLVLTQETVVLGQNTTETLIKK